MKKIYHLLIFTLLLFQGFQATAQDSCSVVIDSVGYNFYQAMPTGESPFTYEWSTFFGSNTDTISYPDSDPLCVTVTDALGCIATACYNADSSCSAYILINNDLYCSPQGLAPFTYEWNTGETTQSIHPTTIGVYSLTVTTASGCQTTLETELSCSTTSPIVELVISDSLSAGSVIYSNIYGTQYGPYTYLWSTSETTEQITPSSFGAYSATITNAIGCTASNSIVYTASCTANITDFGNTLTANHNGDAPFTYSWNTGATTQSINISNDYNSYDVTVTDVNNCVAHAYFDLPLKSIFGTVNPIGISKRIYLIQQDPVAGTLTAVDSLTTVADSSEYSFYNINAGNYLVKAAPLPLFTPTDNFPTYYSGELFWNNATEISVSNLAPSQEANFNLIQGNNPGGSGFIGGLISEGANFTHSGGSSEGEGDPIANQIVHLLKQDGSPIAYTYTDANGSFSFDNLAFADYKLILDIINKTQALKHISLTSDHASANVQFVVNEENIVLSNFQLIKTEPTFTISPNPATNKISIHIDSPKKVDALLNITDISGKIVISKNKTLTTETNINVDVSKLPSGTYFINLLTNDKVLTQKMTKL